MRRVMIVMVLLGGLGLAGCVIPSPSAHRSEGCAGCTTLSRVKDYQPGGVRRR